VLTGSLNTPELRLHHIGFVVGSIAGAVDGFVRLLSARWTGEIFDDPIQRVKVTFLTTRNGAPLIELVEPLAEDSPVAAFFGRGGGLHHLCYEVEELEPELSRIRASGALPLKDPAPAVSFGGRRIAWVVSREGLLVELLEAKLPENSATIGGK
jgi:methylmalonyl-CoA/ethylmalonyl-CoA epimerase